MAKQIFKEVVSENLPIQHKAERFHVKGTTLVKKTGKIHTWDSTVSAKQDARHHVWEDDHTKVEITEIIDMGANQKDWKTVGLNMEDAKEEEDIGDVFHKFFG